MSNIRPNAVIAMIIISVTMSAGAGAQDSVDDFEPGVDTSAPLADEAVPEVPQPKDVDPAVETTPPATPDVTRSRAGNRVMDSMELGRTEITGNQELPKVLYIVPWKKADPGDLIGRPVNSLLDEVLAPIDREEFVRQVDYHDDLYGEEGE